MKRCTWPPSFRKSNSSLSIDRRAIRAARILLDINKQSTIRGHAIGVKVKGP